MDITPAVRHAKASAETDLLKLDNVTGVGLGAKISKGERTETPSIRVYVKKKLPKSKLSKTQLIPEKINGIPTDVIEREFIAHPLAVALDELQTHVDTGTYDPITGGVSVGPCRSIDGFIFVGTGGLVVEDNSTGDPMMLSNFHVMCVDNNWSAGDTMAQPARPDGGACPGDVIAELTRAQLGGQVDGAVARLTGARSHNCRITEIGAVNGTATVSDGDAVRKRGRTTELTHGFVDDVSLTVTVPYDFGIGSVTLTNQIGIEVDASQSTQFGTNGDSGSVVVNASNEVVGLYFAGTEAGDYGVANPIASVFGALDVRLCRPTIGPKNPNWDHLTWTWLDHKPTIDTIWETGPWWEHGGGFTANKRFDDVKNPAGYDTLMETIHEGGGTLWEGGDFTLQEGGGFDPREPGFQDPPGGFGRGPGGFGGGGGAAPFSLSTPHHASGAQRFEQSGQDVDSEIERVREYLRMLEARKRGR